jgi:hypothetical protein
MRWPCRGLCQVPQGRKTRLIASRRGNLLGRCGVVTVITTGQGNGRDRAAALDGARR